MSWDSSFVAVSGSSFHHNYFDGIALYASEHLTFSDFFCYQNDGAGLSLDNNLSLVDFHDGEIFENGDVGIFVRESSELTFSNLRITDNQSHGVFAGYNDSLPGPIGVSRLLFSGCSVTDNAGYGFWLATTIGTNNTLLGCFFQGNTVDALSVVGGATLALEGNSFQ